MFSPDRPEALRRAVEGHRGAGLHRAGRLRRGAGDADRRTSGSPYADRRARGALPARRHDRDEDAASCERLVERHARRPDARDRAVPRPARRPRRAARTRPVIKGETTVKRARAAVRGVPRRRDHDCSSCQQGRELLDRPARGVGRDPGVGHVRLAAGGGAAARPHAAAQGATAGTARFYAVVARDTVDQDFAAHRQRFLAEQGYAYRIVDADDIVSGGIPES